MNCTSESRHCIFMLIKNNVWTHSQLVLVWSNLNTSQLLSETHLLMVSEYKYINIYNEYFDICSAPSEDAKPNTRDLFEETFGKL